MVECCVQPIQMQFGYGSDGCLQFCTERVLKKISNRSTFNLIQNEDIEHIQNIYKLIYKQLWDTSNIKHMIVFKRYSNIKNEINIKVKKHKNIFVINFFLNNK